MSNKMDDMKFIDGYVDTSSLPRVQPGYPRISEARPQERRDPAGPPATRCFKSASLLTDTLHLSAFVTIDCTHFFSTVSIEQQLTAFY